MEPCVSDKTGTLTQHYGVPQSIYLVGCAWAPRRSTRTRREGIPIPPEPKLRKVPRRPTWSTSSRRLQKLMDSGTVGALVHAEHVPDPRGHARPGPEPTNNDFYGGPHRTRSPSSGSASTWGMSLSTSRRAHPWPLKRQRQANVGDPGHSSVHKHVRSSIIARRMTEETGMKAGRHDACRRSLRMLSKGADNAMAVRLREGSMPKARRYLPARRGRHRTACAF